MTLIQTEITGLRYVKGCDTEYSEQWTYESVGDITRTTIDGEVIVNPTVKRKLSILGVGGCLPECTLTLGELTRATIGAELMNMRLVAKQHTYCKWKFNYNWRFDFVVEEV